MRAVTTHHNLVGRDGADRADRSNRNFEDFCHLPVQGPESDRSCLKEIFYDHGVIAEDGPWRGSACLCHPLSPTRGFCPFNRPLLARGGVVRGLLFVTTLPLPRGRGAGGLSFIVTGDRLLVCHLYAQRSSVRGGPSSTGCAFLRHRVHGGPSSTGCAFLCHRVRGGPSSTWCAFLRQRVRGGPSCTGCAFLHHRVHGGPSCTGCAFLHHSVRGGPSSTGCAFLHCRVRGGPSSTGCAILHHRVRGGPSSTGCAFHRQRVRGGPSSTGCAFLRHRVHGGPRVTGRAILHPGLWDSLQFLLRRRSLVFINKTNAHCRQLCSRPAVAFRAPFSFAGGGGGGGGVPVARLSAAPCPLSASSDEEAPVSSHHEVGTGHCSGRPVSRHRRAMMHHTLQPVWSWAVWVTSTPGRRRVVFVYPHTGTRAAWA